MINRPIGFRDSWEPERDRADHMVFLAIVLVVCASGWFVTAVKLIDARHEIARECGR